jgi:hypothetical protein
MTGPLTAATIYEFGGCLQLAHGADALGWLFDYRDAVVVAGAAHLERLAQAPHPDPQRRPGAFVVTPAVEAVAKAQSVRMAMLGYPRRVFLNQDDAHLWVIRRAKG